MTNSVKRPLALILCIIAIAFILRISALSVGGLTKWGTRHFSIATTNHESQIANLNLSLNEVKEPQISPRFSDVTLQAKLGGFRNYNGAEDVANTLETTGAGASFGDYNNDGYLDIYAVNCCNLHALWRAERDEMHKNALYRNNRDGTFTDVTSTAGVGDTGFGIGCIFGDYDNDGDDDLYVTNYGKNILYRNDGDGAFADVTDIAGVGDACLGASCAFADYDNDGDLDLYVANNIDFRSDMDEFTMTDGVKTGRPPTEYHGQPDILYRNNGDGTFTDVTQAAGLPRDASRGLGVAFADYDNDGDQDIYVANDVQPNFLYRNNGDGTFEDVATVAGAAYMNDGTPDAGMGVDFGDYDNDGDLDLLIGNFDRLVNTLFRNEGGTLFTDVSLPSRIGGPSLPFLTFGVKFLDYDNDGHLDIFTANGHVYFNVELINDQATYKQINLLFRNEGNGVFSQVTSIARDGLAVKDVSRAAATGDYDNDGDLDLLVSNCGGPLNLLRNDGGNRNNFLMVKLIGTKSNRDALGARVTVNSHSSNGDDPNCKLSQIRELRSGGSYLADHDRRLFFGLADHESADTIEIRWPSGAHQRFESVSANQLLLVTEGRGADGK